MLVFVTVGSTEFDGLVQAAISKPVVDALENKGYRRMVLQRGNSELGKNVAQDDVTLREQSMQIETWKFKPSIQADIEQADLVISHAGSGTILDVLRAGKPLIVVPNPALLDNHQEELASKLDSLGHLKATPVGDLAPTIKTFEPSALMPFPAFDGSKFVFDASCASPVITMSSVSPTIVADDPQEYEDQHVHAVYDKIASHFSSTRYKPWPIIAKFLSELPVGWIGLDSGTGNGKYLPLPSDRPGSTLTVGLDRSWNLLQIAKHAGSESGALVIREVILGDVLDNGWRPGAFDYAISIATIHHLASYERRKLAIKRLFQCVSRTHGRILIYVWAIEQDELSKRHIPTDEARDIESVGQDVFVPWVMQNTGARNTPRRRQASGEVVDAQTTEAPAPTYNRYYHMFAKGELATLTCAAAQEMDLVIGTPDGANQQGVEIIQDGWERSNYYMELRCWKT